MEQVEAEEAKVIKAKYITSEMDKNCRVSGKVFIVDPCYVICDWQQFCQDSLDALDKHEGIKVESPYGTFFVSSTAYGDGSYPVYKGAERVGEAGVDSGLLSVIPMDVFEKIVQQDGKELNEKWEDGIEWLKKELGVVVEAEGVVEFSGGNIVVLSKNEGNVYVSTDDSADDFDEDDDLDEDDECDDCCEDCDECEDE